MKARIALPLALRGDEPCSRLNTQTELASAAYFNSLAGSIEQNHFRSTYPSPGSLGLVLDLYVAMTNIPNVLLELLLDDPCYVD